MAIALTGAFGLIGSAVRRRLSQTVEVRTIDIHPSADFVADLSEPEQIAALDFSGIETVVHCAGIVDEDFTNPGRAFRQATLGMAALVDRAKKSGARRFIYLSSAHVYGRFDAPFDEASPPNPMHDYAIAHFASEQVLRRSTGAAFRGAVFRPCAVFGIPPDVVRFRRWSLIPFSFPKEAVELGTITLQSRGTQKRNFVGTEDIANAMAVWLGSDDPAHFSIINPIGCETMTVFDFAKRCALLAEQITGGAVGIVRPDGPDLADAFDYHTRDARFVGHTDLSRTVEELMRRLIAGAAKGASA